jgi:hypothetical protein
MSVVREVKGKGKGKQKTTDNAPRSNHTRNRPYRPDRTENADANRADDARKGGAIFESRRHVPNWVQGNWLQRKVMVKGNRGLLGATVIVRR